jgi:hypothetical protein
MHQADRQGIRCIMGRLARGSLLPAINAPERNSQWATGDAGRKPPVLRHPSISIPTTGIRLKTSSPCGALRRLRVRSRPL